MAIDAGIVLQTLMVLVGFFAALWIKSVARDMREIAKGFTEQGKQIVRLETKVEQVISVQSVHEQRLHKQGTQLTTLLGRQHVAEET